MNTVNSCTPEEAMAVYAVLRKRYPEVYADIWNVGLNLGLRISDLLRIKFKDLDLVRSSLKLVESKTGKTKEIRLNAEALAVINKRRSQYPEDVWLFEPHGKMHKFDPVHRVSVSRVLKEAGEWLGLTINTHSMRKSRGAAMYAAKVPIEMIAKTLNHSSTAETLRYLGITQEQVLQTYTEFSFKLQR
jgi:integrase